MSKTSPDNPIDAIVNKNGHGLLSSGLTKREYFAAQALIATGGSFSDPKRAVEYAVQHADALIAELNKDKNEQK